MIGHFSVYKLLSSSQFGFRPSNSTTKRLEYVVKKIIDVIECKQYVGLTLCDLTMGFNILVVRNDFILKKLSSLGSVASCCNFSNHTCSRKLVICVDGLFSDVGMVEYYVPQGSMRGPFIFVVMFNDLPLVASSEPVLYTDNINFVFPFGLAFRNFTEISFVSLKRQKLGLKGMNYC